MAKEKLSNEIHLTRIYEAPLKLVWDAWTDPKQAAKWWGPRGFTLTTHEKDLRPGGSWSYTMHGPDGTDYPNKTLYLEVEKHRRLVYDHGANDDRPALFRVTVTFAELKDGKTQMDMTMQLATPEAAAETKKFIKKAGGNGTWDRLAEYLGQETAGKDQFVINRSFEAPISVLFKMWTDPKHLPQWLPPTGFTMNIVKGEIQAGKTIFYSMSDGHGVTFHGKFEYLDIASPHRIVYSQQFCDAEGRVSRHPMAPTWPETMLATVSFSEEGPGETRVTVTSEVYAEATAAERGMFHDAKGGMTQGWSGSFDKLDEHLITTDLKARES